MAIRVEVLQGSDCFARLRDSWQELCLHVPTATPFQSWEWHSTWFEYFGRSKKPYVLAARQGTDLVGVYPLARRAGAWYVLRSSGIGPSDYLHPLILPECRSEVEELFASHLVSQQDYSLVDLHQLREDLSSLELEGEIALDQGYCLVLDLPGTYDQYLGTLGKSLRYDVRRLDKSLFAEGRAKVDWVGQEGVGAGLEILFDQHKKRWRKRGLPGAFLGKTQSFHHSWGRLAVAAGWLQLGILSLDKSPIGAIYGMAMGDTVFFYQAGFDPEQKAVSPGTLLVASLIRRAIEDGRRHFDFLRGDEPYKRRWKPQRELRNFRKIVAVRGPMGELGAKWNLMGSRVEAKIRARLEGKGLI
jgi:CelD/BcsL family acetyltransferase involved in cellulose biosynthesis